jgi:hypothetical protein
MKKSGLIILASVASVAAIGATDRLWLNNGNQSLGLDVEALDSISVVDDQIVVALTNGDVYKYDRSALKTIDATVDADDAAEVLINYDGDNVTVKNPYAFAGLQITTDGADVVVTKADGSQNEYVYHLTGTTTTGSFKAYSDYKLEVLLDNVSITNDNGSAINIQTGKKTTVRVKDGSVSSLCDSKKYNTPSDEDEKATLFSEGQIEFRGKGTLNITGNKKHAICSDDYVELKNTNINILGAASDGVHANDYVSILSGSLTATNFDGDGIDCDDEGYFTMEGGSVKLDVAGDTRKGIKASGGNVTISGGTIDLTMTGSVAVEDNDPSYCTAIKCGSNLAISGGTINITHSGTAGKGISVDGNAEFTGGTYDINVSGAGGTYTNTSNATDAYSSTCITVDGTCSILAGDFTLNTQSGASGGKCIKSDGLLTIGSSEAGPTINATTRGAQFSAGSSSSSGGGGGWGWFAPGGGGWNGGGGQGGNSSTNNCNPKVIRGGANVVVNNGSLTLTSTTTGEGGEALESKANLTINGGEIVCNTPGDDSINASTSITINGGKTFCYSTSNDGIDSNGTMKITGGVLVAMGSTSPECGIDCDSDSRLTITGGIIFACGGSNNYPGASATTQRYVSTSGTVNSSNSYTLTDPDGNMLMSFKSPVTAKGSSIMISTPYMTSKSMSVKLLKNATVSGGETWQGLTTGGTVSGGTSSSLTTK